MTRKKFPSLGLLFGKFYQLVLKIEIAEAFIRAIKSWNSEYCPKVFVKNVGFL